MREARLTPAQRLRAVADLARPFTLLAPVVGVLCGAVVAAAATGHDLDLRALLAMLSAALATAASNAWNQVFDVQADRVNKPRRPVASGALSRAAALRVGHAAAILALLVFLVVRKKRAGG